MLNRGTTELYLSTLYGCLMKPIGYFLILSPAPGQQGIGVLTDSAQYPTEGVLRQVNQAYRGDSLTPSERTALSKAMAEQAIMFQT